MYTRNVRIKLKANGVPEFACILEKEIIPLLRAHRMDFRMKCSSSLRSGMKQ